MQKLCKLSMLNINIKEANFSVSKTYRVMRIFDACKSNKTSLFSKDDEDEFWKMLKHDQNLTKIDKYISQEGKFELVTDSISTFLMSWLEKVVNTIC